MCPCAQHGARRSLQQLDSAQCAQAALTSIQQAYMQNPMFDEDRESPLTQNRRYQPSLQQSSGTGTPATRASDPTPPRAAAAALPPPRIELPDAGNLFLDPAEVLRLDAQPRQLAQTDLAPSNEKLSAEVPGVDPAACRGSPTRVAAMLHSSSSTLRRFRNLHSKRQRTHCLLRVGCLLCEHRCSVGLTLQVATEHARQPQLRPCCLAESTVVGRALLDIPHPPPRVSSQPDAPARVQLARGMLRVLRGAVCDYAEGVVVQGEGGTRAVRYRLVPACRVLSRFLQGEMEQCAPLAARLSAASVPSARVRRTVDCTRAA